LDEALLSDLRQGQKPLVSGQEGPSNDPVQGWQNVSTILSQIDGSTPGSLSIILQFRNAPIAPKIAPLLREASPSFLDGAI
jgi:hypothetical protein